MVAGQTAFEGKTFTELSNEILFKEPKYPKNIS
jgi:hypothetical protein